MGLCSNIYAEQHAFSEPTLAEKSMEDHAQSIYQVRIVNKGSNSQNSLGTGFVIDDGNLLATNYHVVSSAVLKPTENYAVIEVDGQEQELEILRLDVIHDLAILKLPTKGTPIPLSRETPVKGARLYSIGNPLDIGMTIVEGNYNGLVESRFFDQIHFSGAINSGMSGGPTLNQYGEVVGINVASAGNQVGFLVPVSKLITLLESEHNERKDSQHPVDLSSDQEIKAINTEKVPLTTLQASIGQQIQSATHSMIERLLEEPWPQESLGSALVAGKAHSAIDCWGKSDTNNKTHLTRIEKGCNSRDGMFISHHLRSGYIEYEFWYIEADDWPASAFYRYAAQAFSHAGPGNRAGGQDVDNFSCIDQVVIREHDKFKRKLSYCTRPYTLFPELFDTFYIGSSLDKNDRVIMEHFTLSGVNKADSERFLENFMQQVGWQ
ncbi:MAG: serine protease Do [Flavobacteriales bacterium]|jgi:serine protease Do